MGLYTGQSLTDTTNKVATFDSTKQVLSLLLYTLTLNCHPLLPRPGLPIPRSLKFIVELVTPVSKYGLLPSETSQL